MSRRGSDEPERITGAWWVASDPNKRVPGVLERKPAGHGVLRVEGVLVRPPHELAPIDPEPIALILGETGDGRGRVSLIDCYESDRSNTEGWAPGPSSQSFAARFTLASHTALIGDDATVLEQPDPLIHAVWTRLDVLDQWGDRGPFAQREGTLEHLQDDSYSSTVTLRWPADLRSQTRVGEITLTTPPVPSGASWFNYRYTAERRCYLDCRLDPAVPLSQLSERLLNPLRNFFALATDSQPAFTQLNVSLAQDSHGPTDLWCALAALDANGNARVLTEDEADDAVRQGFFTVRHIVETFDEVVAQWFESFEELETPITSILAAADYGSQRFTSDHFQSAAFAAEALHRSLGLVVESVPEEQRKEIGRRMFEALTPDERRIDWLASRARGVAAPRYEDRLAQLLDRAPLALQDAAGADFPRRVKRARNYFAHLDDRTLSRPTNDELHRLTSLLVLVMVAELLRKLGVDDIESRVRYADRFYELQRHGLVIATKSDDGRETFVASPADGP
jgi:hypothetical protein